MLGVIKYSRVMRGGRGLRARKFSTLKRYNLTEDRNPMAIVVLAALAAATTSELGVGLTALFVAMSVVSGLLVASAWPLDVLGAAGSVALMYGMVVTPECSGEDKAVRLVTVALVGSLLVVAVGLGRRWGGQKTFPLVTLFGLLDLLRFATAPAGVTLSPTDGWHTVVVSVAIVLLGIFYGVLPRLAAPLIAVATLGTEVSASVADPGLPCGSQLGTRLTVMVLFLVLYLLARWFRRALF
jgi:hypothetical protein